MTKIEFENKQKELLEKLPDEFRTFTKTRSLMRRINPEDVPFLFKSNGLLAVRGRFQERNGSQLYCCVLSAIAIENDVPLSRPQTAWSEGGIFENSLEKRVATAIDSDEVYLEYVMIGWDESELPLEEIVALATNDENDMEIAIAGITDGKAAWEACHKKGICYDVASQQ